MASPAAAPAAGCRLLWRAPLELLDVSSARGKTRQRAAPAMSAASCNFCGRLLVLIYLICDTVCCPCKKKPDVFDDE